MLNLRETIDRQVGLALRDLLSVEEAPLAVCSLSRPGFLDYSFSLPLKLARTRHKAPVVIAQELQPAVAGMACAGVVEAVAPGYINMQLSDSFVADQLTSMLRTEPAVLLQKEANGQKIQVEFVSANPTGPLHVGNGRGAALGSVLATLLETQGYHVDREYYVNDYGSKMRLFTASIAHYLFPMLGLEHAMPDEGYHGAYIADLAQAIYDRRGSELSSLLEEQRLAAIEEDGKTLVLAWIRRALEEMGVSFDTWFSERYLVENGWNARVLQQFRDRGVVYQKDDAVWLRSTDFGDDKDRVLVRRDGEPTYTLTDAAYHFNKFQRGYVKSIDVFGADHIGHIVPMHALMKSLGLPDDFLEIIIYQIVHFLRGGQRVVLSKQTGEIIELADLVREVGRDQTRVFFLLSSADSELEFDLEAAKENSLDNPAYYLKYTHARLCSVERQVRGIGAAVPSGATPGDILFLKSPEDRELLKCLLTAQDEVDDAARTRQPHRVLYLAGELAKAANTFYQKEKVIQEDAALARARMVLVLTSQRLLKAYAHILGVTLPESM
ncbi:MAG: arginine--tRNA ligase [Caldiserica bacterium]|nr:arginine--tRNA ligase [Caldisericota bacterium]